MTPILIIVVANHQHLALSDPNYVLPDFIATVHSVASLLSWIKFLYFLRIFRLTGK